MSVGTRNTIAIVVFVVVFFWAAGTAEPRTGYGSAPGGGYASVVEVICDVFGKRKCAAAVRVATCESRLNPRAVGGAGERGIYQIHPVHFGWAKPSRLFEPRWNALVARRLSRGGTNWGPWTCGWAA